MSSSDVEATRPRVLFVYYTHTQQTLKVADVMAGVLRERGCDVSEAGIEFTDPRYREKFSRFGGRSGDSRPRVSWSIGRTPVRRWRRPSRVCFTRR
jgi:hypothetical protein